MAEVAFPLDSDIIGYDGGLPVYSEQYGSQALRDVFKRFFSTGVFGEDMLQVVKTTDKPAGEDTIVSVTINPGAAIINGGIYTNDAPVVMTKTVPLATSSQTQVVKKYHVVLGFEKPATQTERFYRVLKETYDYSAYEDLTRTTTKYEIALATITARAVYQNGQSKCTVTVQDRRLDTDYCGLAVPFREFDSTAFGAELASMARELQRQTDTAVQVSQNAIDGTTAGELTQTIADLETSKLDDDNGSVKRTNIASAAVNDAKLDIVEESSDVVRSIMLGEKNGKKYRLRCQNKVAYLQYSENNGQSWNYIGDTSPQSGTYSATITFESTWQNVAYKTVQVTFPSPMPSADYQLLLTVESGGRMTGACITSKTATGFTAYIYQMSNNHDANVQVKLHWLATMNV